MDIAALLPGHPWSADIHFFDCIDSTNTYLQSLAERGAPAGTVILADRQTAGRGRMGRSFHSPAGSGLYMSVLLRPLLRPEQLMHLTCAVAVAACRAIENATGFRPQIKWVNDIVWEGKKLGGILTTISIDSSTGLADRVIVGIGINCSNTAFPDELKEIATSLSTVTGRNFSREKLAAELVRQLEIMARELIDCQGAYMAYYRENCVVKGKRVQLIRGEERREATVLNIDDNGALIVHSANGSTEIINSGEVSLRSGENYI